MLLPAPIHASAHAARGGSGELSPAASPNLLSEHLIIDLQECLGGEWQEPSQRFSSHCQLSCETACPHICLFSIALLVGSSPCWSNKEKKILITVK